MTPTNFDKVVEIACELERRTTCNADADKDCAALRARKAYCVHCPRDPSRLWAIAWMVARGTPLTYVGSDEEEPD